MNRTLISAIVGLSLMGATMAASVERAEAHPALIFGIVAWKVVALVASGVIAGVVLSNAAHAQPYAYAGGCVIHHHPSTGQPYVRADCR